MHMADALVSPAVGGTMWAATAGTTALACRRVRQGLDDRRVPLMGVLGSFVFAAQMVNFQVPGTGSSGHLGGALLLAILAGCGALAYVMFGRCCATSTARDEQHTRIIRGVDDVLSNMRTVISFGKEADEIGLLAVEQAEYARLAQKTKLFFPRPRRAASRARSPGASRRRARSSRGASVDGAFTTRRSRAEFPGTRVSI